MAKLTVTGLAFASAILLAACSSTPDNEVASAAAPSTAPTTETAPAKHCEGSEWVDNSSVAVLPVPFVAFFVPHADTNDIKEDSYVKRCGDRARLQNEKVQVSKAACVPAGLTRIVTLGVWQWCPAHVSWEADVR